jgi:hypothetical protein
MLSRRVLQVGVALAALLGPFAVVAHAELFGTVTTAPNVVAGAPAMGMPMVALLAVLLAGGGAYMLRRTRSGAIAKVALIAALTALAGLTYATDGVLIEGADCGMQTVHQFIPGHTLLSNCTNPIRIIDIQLDCFAQDPPGQCRVGQVLTTGQSCTLPMCNM